MGEDGERESEKPSLFDVSVDGERQEIDWVSVQMETDRVTA